jgi:hypothetical protein
LPDRAPAAGGRVYVAWADYRDDSNNAEVYTRVLDFDPNRIARPALPIERRPLPWPIPKPAVTH